MNYDDLINYIEDESIKMFQEPYYHAFQYDKEQFVKMLTEGIKAPILLGKRGDGNNGLFYVCLSQNKGLEKSIYDKLNNNPMFVINGNIKTIKSRNFIRTGHYQMDFMQTPLPFRESQYDDEYQRFLRISPRKFLAIQYNIFSNYQQNHNPDYIGEQLIILKQMIDILETHKIYLPIIDGSTMTKINKTKVKLLKI